MREIVFSLFLLAVQHVHGKVQVNPGIRGLAEGKELPNVNEATYSFNAVIGLPPKEQRASLIGVKIFDLIKDEEATNLLGTITGYFRYKGIKDISTQPSCLDRTKEEEIWYSTSSDKLESQTKSTSHGWEQSTDIGVTVPVQGAEVSAETTIRNAAVFGNSRSSQTALSWRQSGYSYTFDASLRRSLYSIEIDHKTVEWDTNFLLACEQLGESPTTEKILDFFQEFGTHGLKKVSFGQVCTSAIYMEGGYSMSSYKTFKSQARTSDIGYLHWTSRSSSASSKKETKESEEGFQYVNAEKECSGELEHASGCNTDMPGTRNAPAIVAWTYEPIWEMPIGTLSAGAKNKMKQTMIGLMEAAVVCRMNSCSNQGACVPSKIWWNNPNQDNMSGSFDSNTCFCDKGFVGQKCGEASPIDIGPPVWDNQYANDFDGIMNFNSPGDKPICGVKSEHNNHREDRIYKFRTCAINDSKYYVDFRQTGVTTAWDDHFRFQCEANKVLVGVYSVHDNDKEDRTFQFKCAHFVDTKTESCVGFDRAYVNDYDAPFEFGCKDEKVIVGVESVHSNHKEDRRFKFHCCSIVPYIFTSRDLMKASWTDYLNNFDQVVTTRPKLDGADAAICGISSYHSNHNEDRRFKFKYCRPSDTRVTRSERYHFYDAWETYVTNYDSEWTAECGKDYVLSHMDSYHNNKREDRVFLLACHKWGTWKTDQCWWTKYRGGQWYNDYDQEFTFDCGEQGVLAGVKSKHNNDREDRLFSFMCCRWMPSQ